MSLAPLFSESQSLKVYLTGGLLVKQEAKYKEDAIHWYANELFNLATVQLSSDRDDMTLQEIKM